MRYQAKHREPGASQVQAWYVLVDAVRSSSPEQQQNKTETTTNKQNRTDTNQQTDGQRNQRPTPGTEQNQTTDNRTNVRSEETSKNMQRNQEWEIVERRSCKRRKHKATQSRTSRHASSASRVRRLCRRVTTERYQSRRQHACKRRQRCHTYLCAEPRTAKRSAKKSYARVLHQKGLKNTQTPTACQERSYATTPQLSRKREIGLIQLCKVQGMRARRYLPIEFVLPGQSRWLPSQLTYP